MNFNLMDMDDGVPLWRPPVAAQPATQDRMVQSEPMQLTVSSSEAARRVRLPEFWISAPKQWFNTAEARFRTYGVTDSVDKFNVAVAALPEQVARHASHILDTPPQLFPYEELRHHLTTHHELSNFEKVERIVSGEPLGARKPSEMLAAMMEFCPKGEERSSFLAFFFLQRLPTEMRVLLSEDDHTELRQLAASCLSSVWSSSDRSTRISVGSLCKKKNARKDDFSSPLGQNSIIAASISDGFLAPKGSPDTILSTFSKLLSSWCVVR